MTKKQPSKKQQNKKNLDTTIAKDYKEYSKENKAKKFPVSSVTIKSQLAKIDKNLVMMSKLLFVADAMIFSLMILFMTYWHFHPIKLQ